MDSKYLNNQTTTSDKSTRYGDKYLEYISKLLCSNVKWVEQNDVDMCYLRSYIIVFLLSFGANKER